jgi:hypothetical protein
MKIFNNKKIYCICITTKKSNQKIYLYSFNKQCLSCVNKIQQCKIFNNFTEIKKFKRKINRVYGNRYYKNISILKLNIFQIILLKIYSIFKHIKWKCSNITIINK